MQRVPSGFPFSLSGHRGNDSEVDHLLQGLLDLVMILNGYFPLDIMSGRNNWVDVYGVSTRHISDGIK